MPELSEILAAHRGSGYVVAPAGFGKTHLIAESVRCADARQLVLTHTYAGANALRRKMRELSVRDGACRVDTIASWALRLSLSYPAASGWTIERPNQEQWAALYGACSALLDHPFIRRIVRASYAGLYVDEYQDCSRGQHELVLKLARDLPCRILGDPLQGIFDFNGEPVEWDRDVSAAFECLGQLDTPHRWERAGSLELGRWLRNIREAIDKHQDIDLTRDRVSGVTFKVANDADHLIQTQANACRYFECDPADSVIAIHKGHQQYKVKCHLLARNLAGRFSSIEEIEGRDLFSFITKIERARNNKDRLKRLIAFAKASMSAVPEHLPAATTRGEHVLIRGNTRNPSVASAANAYLAEPNSINMAGFLTALKAVPDTKVFRADLFNRTIGVLRRHALYPQLTLTEAAEKYHADFRNKGRPIGHRRLIGTTLLVKGLEFDHAIVLDAGSLSRKELYVALTRGARSLTIISCAPVLHPTD